MSVSESIQRGIDNAKSGVDNASDSAAAAFSRVSGGETSSRIPSTLIYIQLGVVVLSLIDLVRQPWNEDASLFSMLVMIGAVICHGWSLYLDLPAPQANARWIRALVSNVHFHYLVYCLGAINNAFYSWRGIMVLFFFWAPQTCRSMVALVHKVPSSAAWRAPLLKVLELLDGIFHKFGPTVSILSEAFVFIEIFFALIMREGIMRFLLLNWFLIARRLYGDKQSGVNSVVDYVSRQVKIPPQVSDVCQRVGLANGFYLLSGLIVFLWINSWISKN